MTVYLRPEAQEDLNAAADWYERQKPGLGPE
jgi:plasmid stabilization system protein ParE